MYDNKIHGRYWNIPASFDIETTSTYINGNKVAFMYEWTFCIYGYSIAGRTWEEWIDVYTNLLEIFSVSLDNRLVIYIHNLSFEFQFIRKRFEWNNVFSVDDRKPAKAVTVDGVEFRCSHILSGYSLAKLSSQLRKYKIEKKVGDLDYSKIRHYNTPLTDKEMGYCYADVQCVVAYIQEKIESDGDITKIPLTKTGYVRNHCRNACLYVNSKNHKKDVDNKFKNYRKIMNRLTLDATEYSMLHRAFQGGFTHANADYSGQVLENVTSFDFTSSYPAVMFMDMFPMGKGEYCDIRTHKELYKNLDLYCCVFEIEILGLESCQSFEHPISSSRCWIKEGVLEDNGRVVRAERVVTTITEQDFKIIKLFYTWDKIRIGKFIRYKKGYLPTDFILSVLQLYAEKTQLKNVEGKEYEYAMSKEKVNSAFGMAVTDIVRDEIIYNTEWTTEEPDIDLAIQKYNKSKGRFLFYGWGVWITAHARRRLFSGIYECKDDYVYADTDSIKILNADKHRGYIEAYNLSVERALRKACEWHSCQQELCRPKTIEGIEKILGVWEEEGTYDKFKTLGAKRYIYEKNGNISITVSGVNKHHALPYLLEKYGKEGVFDVFDDGLVIPANKTGKLTHTYIDEEFEGEIEDYLGNKCYVKELSSIHLEPCEYSLSLSSAYMEFLLGLKEGVL